MARATLNSCESSVIIGNSERNERFEVESVNQPPITSSLCLFSLARVH